jgi:hypothetical protein
MTLEILSPPLPRPRLSGHSSQNDQQSEGPDDVSYERCGGWDERVGTGDTARRRGHRDAGLYVWFREDPELVLWTLTGLEIASALWRLVREGSLGEETLASPSSAPPNSLQGAASWWTLTA